jgi:hypothetical protein
MLFPKRQERRRFWEALRAGESRTEAALAADVPNVSQDLGDKTHLTCVRFRVANTSKTSSCLDE